MAPRRGRHVLRRPGKIAPGLAEGAAFAPAELTADVGAAADTRAAFFASGTMSPAADPVEDLAPVPEWVDRDTPPNTSSATIDGRTVRSAVAGSVLGALAQKTRPSQLLGDGRGGSLLGSTMDGFWGMGQQAAMRFIVEGEAPDSREIKRQAVQIVAAAANQELAGLIGNATQYGQDNGIKFLRNLEVKAEWFPGWRPSLEARTIDSLFESEALDHTVFLEAAVRSDSEDTTINAGLGYRYLVPGSDWMLGINAFYDQQFPIGHQRMSLGVEASTSDFTVFGNRYVALSGWAKENANFEEKPLSGWDAGIAGALPRMEDLRVSLSAFHWDQETGQDKTGLKFTADYDVSPALQLGTTLAGDDAGDFIAGLRLTYQLGADNFGGGGAGSAWGPESNRRLAFVNRENVILTEEREIPNDYTIQFLASGVNTSNQNALAFELAGAPSSASYSYEISSSGGGAPVTGTGLVRAAPQVIPGIDVSGLTDGILTLTLRVVSNQGAVGPEVTTQISKSTSEVTVTISPLTTGTAATSPIPFQIVFSTAVTGFDLSDLVVANGTATNLQTADNVTWTVDITPTGQGSVELEVPAAVATGGDNPNAASNRPSVVYDSEPPSGYSASFLFSPIASAIFEIGAGETGASYSFTIVSSGGGTPVTGTGTISSPQQQVTGLDLSGLGDGTLTLSLTLSDAAGNAGSAVTATMAKDASPPTIVALIPPANGNYDEL
ncbi:inverse autotransporter beta domain-containing protein [Aestuariivirga sp.]|uniref:inverse autotransporter beta domain-containing protein n=1 Tax=Aestuariivirga sp. TaxID=2650926 RepID=UPI003BAB9275